jgi:uncharacterized protein (DUF58 family)
VAAGAHGRRRTGPGETFWQFRSGQPGDPAAAIDWRQSARGQRLYVRETEWAAAQTVWLWCDRSPSMAWRSQRDLPDKGARAAVLGLALAALLLKAGERVGVLGRQGSAPGRAGMDLGRIGHALLAAGPGELSGDLPGAAGLPRHGEVVLVSDFLQPLQRIEAAVRALAATGASGQMVQVLDPAEETLPFAGRVRFAGLEGEGETLVRRAEDLRDGYGERLTRHRDGLAAIAGAAGWGLTTHHTDQPPEAALLALHVRLAGPRRGGRR